MTASEWLNETRPDGRTNVSRLAELMHVNGGLLVRGWGVICGGGGPYGRGGLDQNEAMELIFLGGVVEGFMIAGTPFETLKGAVDAEIQRVTKEWEAAMGVSA